MRRRRGGAWRAALAFAAAGLAAMGPGATAPAVAADPAPTIRLLGQTSVVAPGGELDLCVQVAGVPNPGATEVAVSIYPRVATRSNFQETLTDKGLRSPLSTPASSTVGALAPDACGSGGVTVRLPLTRLNITREGVYPVRVDLRDADRGSVLDHFVTYLILLPPTRSGPPLEAAVVMPVHAPPALRPDGLRRLDDVATLRQLARTIQARPGTPLVIDPTPETLQALAAPPAGDAGQETLNALRSSLTDRQLLAGPYVPVDAPALLAAGLDNELSAQVTRGSDTVTQTLLRGGPGGRPDTRTWVADGPLDDASLAFLRERGFDRVVVREDTLVPVPSQVTLTRPFALEGRPLRRQEAVAADSGLAAHFTNDGSPVLQANHLLADLAVLYLDAPADTRGVVVAPPRSWRPDPAFFETLLSGMSQAGFVQPVTLDTLFTSVRPAVGPEGDPLIRHVQAPPATSGDPTAGVLRTRRRLDAFGTVVELGNERYATMNDQVLVAQSDDLTSSRQRAPYLDAVDKEVASQLSRIQVPRDRSITLTARQGQIPVTFRNLTGFPVHVQIRVRSDRLLVTEPVRDRTLVRENTTERFSVTARSTGEFPLRVTVSSPEGGLVVGESVLKVRSTAGFGAGILLSAGAALFLAGWWARHFVRGRRARRLVPA